MHTLPGGGRGGGAASSVWPGSEGVFGRRGVENYDGSGDWLCTSPWASRSWSSHYARGRIEVGFRSAGRYPKLSPLDHPVGGDA